MVYEYYAQGVGLLRQHGNLSVMQLRQFEAYLGRGFVPTEVENRLKLEIGKLSPALSPPLTPKGGPTSANLSESFPPPLLGPPLGVRGGDKGDLPFWANLFHSRPDAPDELLDLRERAVELHKRESLAHGQMGVAAKAGKKKVAFDLAKEIMEDIRPALDGIYDAVREWEKTGKLPAAPVRDTAAQTVMADMIRLKYCNERLSRLRAWLSTGERVMTVKGERAVVRLDAKQLQVLDNERVDREMEAKGLKEKLGL